MLVDENHPIDVGPPVDRGDPLGKGYRWRGIDVDSMTHDAAKQALKEAIREVVRLHSARTWGR